MQKKSVILVLISLIVIGQVFLIYKIVFADHSFGDNSIPAFDGTARWENFQCAWDSVRDCHDLRILTNDSINSQAYEARVWGTAHRLQGQDGEVTVMFCLSNSLPMAAPPAICGTALYHGPANRMVLGQYYPYDQIISVDGTADLRDFNYTATHIRVDGSETWSHITARGRRIKIQSLDVPPPVVVGDPIVVRWTLVNSYGNVYLMASGPVSPIGTFNVREVSSMTFTATGTGTANFSLRAEWGPGENGPTYVDEGPKSVTITNPPGEGVPGPFTLSSSGQCLGLPNNPHLRWDWTDSQGASRYEIFRQRETTGTLTSIGFGTSPYIFNNPVFDNGYWLRVDAINDQGGRRMSEVVWGGVCRSPGGPLVCDPSTQTVQVGNSANFSASGGVEAGTYQWTAPGGDPVDATGPTFSTRYSSSGPRTVTVRRDPDTATCNVNVTSQPPTGCQGDCAEFVSQIPPPSTTMITGQTVSVSVTMRNTGTTTWSCCTTNPSPPPGESGDHINNSFGYKLGTISLAEDQVVFQRWGILRIPPVPTTVLPGQEAIFNFNITAPLTPGDYNFQWQMLQEHLWRFGQTTPNVIVTVNPPPLPSVQNVTVTEPNYCFAGPGGTVSWTPSQPQSAYRVQVDERRDNFLSPIIDSCPGGPPNGTCAPGTTATSYSMGSGILAFNETYEARVMVRDMSGNWSPWRNMSICNGPGCQGGGNRWQTPLHAYPQVDFNWSPLNPPVNRPVQFTDETTFALGSTARAWRWTFNGGTPSSSLLQSPPLITYAASGSYQQTLEVRDDAVPAGQYCFISNELTVQRPIPIWKEVAPR